MADAAVDMGTPSAEEVLRSAVERFGSRVTLATSFGAEGCVLVDLIARNKLPIDMFVLDTGVLFPETYALWKQLEAHYGITIRGVKFDTPDAVPGLWTTEPDRCCELRKIVPLRRELAHFDAWITAIRREQTPERATAELVETDKKFGLTKLNPLAYWTHDDVWGHIYANDVPYNPLHEQNYPSIGCQPCTSPVVPGENLRAGRWRGTAKRECGLHLAPTKGEP
jgi:phosphoadenylyl-sulfate reductase (thioredoxin)